MTTKKRLVIGGLGNRGIGCFAKGIQRVRKEHEQGEDLAEIVALVDTNSLRCEFALKELDIDVPCFSSMEECAKEIEADWAIVTTVDKTHCDVVCAALVGGINVLVDKPLATSAQECDKACPHAFDNTVRGGYYKRMYFTPEAQDGYIRDLCVFSDRHTIDDTEHVHVEYSKGTLMSFSMITYSTREYVSFIFTGTKGRIEFGSTFHDKNERFMRIAKEDGVAKDIDLTEGSSEHAHEHGHGGADAELLNTVIGVPGVEIDPIKQATPEEARLAVLIADVAARSKLENGKMLNVSVAGNDFPPHPNKKNV